MATNFTVTHALQEAYKKLGQLNISTATGGSSSTIVDTKQSGQHEDGDWGGAQDGGDGWAVIIHSTDSAAPEGEFSGISNYVDNTGTFSLRSTLTTSVGAGDRYGFASDFYPHETMVEMLNSALQSLGDVPQTDTTTLDTAANKSEYAASLVWKRNPPYRIDFQTKLNDADDNLWQEISHGEWEYVPAVGGTTGLLILPHLPASRDIRVWYQGKHAYVSDFDDDIYEGFDPELVCLMTAEKALEWQNSRLQGGDPFLLQRLNDIRVQVAERDVGYTVWRPPTKAKIFAFGSKYDNDEDNFLINP